MKILEIGLTGQYQTLVGPAQTATAMGSGDVEAFATPALVAVMEAAAVAALAGYLPEDETSLGVYIDVQHLAASPIGAKISALAEVIALEEAHVIFSIEARDEHELIGKGTHRRTIVKKARFLEKLGKKSGA